MNWKRVKDEDLVRRRALEQSMPVRYADAGDCVAHYRIDCAECKEKWLINKEWDARVKPHSVAVSVGGICSQCGLPSDNYIHSSNYEHAKKEARIQSKLRREYIDKAINS